MAARREGESGKQIMVPIRVAAEMRMRAAFARSVKALVQGNEETG